MPFMVYYAYQQEVYTMMKKILSLLLTLLMLLSAAAAEYTFDVAELERTPDCYVYVDEGTPNTVVRPLNQPFIGELNDIDGMLIAYLDYVNLVNEEAVLLRLTVSTALPEMLAAGTMTVTVDKTDYVFTVTSAVDEYDRTYYEDYVVCFGETGLKMLKAIAQRKEDTPLAITLSGDTVVTGNVIIPGETAAELYDRFIDLGGKKQPLKAFDEQWPVKVVQRK